MSALRAIYRFVGCLAVLLAAGTWLRTSAQAPSLGIELVPPGQVRFTWPVNAGAYRLEETPDFTQRGSWLPVGTAPNDVNGLWTVTLPPAADSRHFRLRTLPGKPTFILESSPAHGESGVAVTRETILRLSDPLAADVQVGNDQFQATFAGRRILSRIQVSADRRTVTLFYLEPLPGGARLRVTFRGDGLRDVLGRDVDADGDGTPGGTAQIDFTTTPLQALADTAVVGRVFASELAPTPGGESLRVPLAGVTITVDGMEETQRTVTDAFGNFRLSPVPAGDFFVHIDGRTAVRTAENPFPQGAFYPIVGKRWSSLAGQEINVDDVYLPLILEGTLKPVSATEATLVGFNPAVLADHPELAGVSLTVPPNALFSDSGTRGGSVGIAPVAPDRLPSPLPPGLDFPVVITVQTDGPLNFDQPVPVCFPNLPDPVTGRVAPPGSKSALWSFNHDIGEWEIVGPMTVSADGKHVCTDPGVGIRQPGWHGERPGNQANGGNTRSGNPRDPTRPRPTADQECAKNDCPCDGTCATGHEVFLHNGEEVLTRTDLVIPGRAGMDFRLDRTYRSRLDYNGPLGHGWSFRYNESLFFEPNGDVTRFTGRSHGGTWRLNPDGSYTPPDGYFGVLLRMPDGAFLLVEPDGFQRLFRGTDGRVYCHQDRFGNRMLFDYDARGNLSRVIDVFGREIRLAFETGTDGIDRLATVEDFTGRTVRYTYDNRGDLVAVTGPRVTGTSTGNDFPAGRTERYTYSSGFAQPALNHNILSLTMPEEVASGGPPMLVWTYGTDPANPATFDRVLTETEGGTNASGIAAGGTRRFEYDGVNISEPPGQPDLPRGRARVTERNGNRKEYFVNERNLHILTRELTRGLRPGEPAAYETRSFYDADGQLVRRIHPEGNEDRWTYDSTGPRRSRGNVVTRRRVADPERGGGPDLVTTYTYEPLFNQLLTVTDPRGNAPGFVPALGDASPARYTTRFFYDYQESTAPVPLATLLGISLAGIPRGLGDLNGDGRTDQVAGNPVRTEAPDVLLRPDAPASVRNGPADRQRVLHRTQWNDRGQVIARIDPLGNLTRFTYFPEDDPDGDGQPTFAPYVGLSPVQRVGYMASMTVDAPAPGPRDPALPPFAALETRFAYDRVGNLSGIRSPRGVWTRFERNALNEPIQTLAGADVTDAVQTGNLPTGEAPLALRTRFHYDANGRIVRRESENRDNTTPGVGPWVEDRFVYDILGDVRSAWSEVDATGGVTTRFTYDADRNLVRTTRAEGNTTLIVRDERNLPLLETRGFGTAEAATRRFEYDLNGNPVRVLDAEDNDGDGQPEATRVVYDGFDRAIATIDPLGNRTEITLDPASTPTRRRFFGHPANEPAAPQILLAEARVHTDELGRVFRMDQAIFVPAGSTPARPAELTDADNDGWTTQFMDFDAASRLVQTVEDDGQTRTYLHDGAGRRIASRDHLGNTTAAILDPDSNPTRVTRREVADLPGIAPQEFVSVLVYDQLGRLVRTTDNAGETSRMTYDSRGNRIAVSDAQGSPAPDPLGLVPGGINAPGNTTTHVYDGLNRLVSTTRHLRRGGTGAGAPDTSNESNPDGEVTVSFAWDLNSRLASIRDDNGNVTRFNYDALDRRTRTTHPDGTFELVTFDRDDQPVETTDAAGTRVRYVHDAAGRMIRTEVVQAATGVAGSRTTTYSHDGLGRVTRSTDDNGDAATRLETSEWMHDSLGRVIQERQNGAVVTTHFSGDGKRASTIFPGGRRIDRTFDLLDRVRRQASAGAMLSESHWMGGGFRELLRHFGNGATLSHLDNNGNQVIGFDADRRPTRQRVVVRGVPVVDREYAYNRTDLRVSEVRHDDHDLADAYTYDSLYRIVASTFDNGGSPGALGRALEQATYRLDGVGNRRRVGRTGELPADQSLSVNSLNQYTQVGGVPQAHSAAGNLTDDGNHLFAYDHRNRLIAVRRRTDQALIAEYRYDAEGRRRQKAVFNPDSPAQPPRITRFAYDGWTVCEEQSGSGQTLASFVGAPGYIDAHAQMERTANHPLGSGTFYFHQNARFDVVAVTDAAGNVVEKTFYDDFGRAYDEGKLPTSASDIGNPYGFQGARLDAETGLYYLRNRHYNPATGRFLQRDPLPDPGNSANLYSFAWNSPVSVLDPAGLCAAGLEALYSLTDTAVDIVGQGTTIRDIQKGGTGADGFQAPGNRGLAAAKLGADLVNVHSAVQSYGAARAGKDAFQSYLGGLKANQEVRAGLQGAKGVSDAKLARDLNGVRSARAAAANLDKFGKGMTVVSGAIAAAQAADRQLDLNAENRRMQDSNTTSYFNSLDAANDLIRQLRQQRDCGKLTQAEFLQKLEAIQRAVQSANEGWDASEAGRFKAHLASTVENALNGVLDALPGGSSVGKFFGWLAGDTFVVK